MASAITVENVTKMFRLYHDRNQSLKATIMRRGRARYEEFLALDDVSLDIQEGTTYGLIGHNGSGKSTMLKCMARILRPDAGSIAVNGKISALLELGAGFHPELSGKENIFLNGAILGIPSKEIGRKYDEIVEFAGLEKFIDTPVKNYSSGMYVRLGFSVAINVDPDILLVDEVLAVGDEAFQRKCNEKFADLRDRNKTIVVVSHGLGTMRSLCDEVAWFDHGVLKMQGPSNQVVDAYVEEVQTDRTVDEHGDEHWGPGDVRIDRLELIGPDGHPTDKVHTGDRVALRYHYTAREPIAAPVFSMAVTSLTGVVVTNPKSTQTGVVLDEARGSGYVDCVVPRLMLLPGTYDVAISVHDRHALNLFDHVPRALRFDVEVGRPHDTGAGVMTFDSRWTANTEFPATEASAG